MTEVIGSEDGFNRRLMKPPENYKFKHLLDEFCKELNENDLSNIKYIFEGIVTANVKSWNEMFEILRCKNYISNDNIVYLQKIALHQDKGNLFLKTLQYRKENENEILHFRMESLKLGDEEIVEIHVRGHKCTTQGQLDDIRTTIANILMVDKANVKVAGVQEANSVLITIILPKKNVKILQLILTSNNTRGITEPLARRGVDTISIDNIRYPIEMEDEEEAESIEQTKVISNLQDLLSQKENQIKKMENELLQRRRDKMTDEIDDGMTKSISHVQVQLCEKQIESGKLEEEIHLLQSNKTNQSDTIDEKGTKRKVESNGGDEENHSNICEVSKRDQEENPPKKFKSEEPKLMPGQESLNQFDLPEDKRHLKIKPEDINCLFVKKMAQLSSMSTTFRKIVVALPKYKFKNTMTLEEIDALSLHKKIDRIYPPYSYLKAT